MPDANARVRRRLLVPETIQSSLMDCGPAALKSLLSGFNLDISYSFLREACETGVDGTSIDVVEDVATRQGLGAEQIVIPREFVLLPNANALPSVVVLNEHGFTHFVVAWRHAFGRVQIMDPAVGRRWLRTDDFERLLHIHSVVVPATDWYQWASSEEALECMRDILKNAGPDNDTIERLTEQALADGNWRSLAGLHAAARMVRSVARSSGIRKASRSGHLVEAIFQKMRADKFSGQEMVPDEYWPALPAAPEPGGEPSVIVRGAVLVRVRSVTGSDLNDCSVAASDTASPPHRAPHATERKAQPAFALFDRIKEGGLRILAILVPAMLLSSGALVVEALLFRGLLELTNQLAIVEQRIVAVGLVIGFLTLSFLLNVSIASESLRIGRHLETRMRLALLHKLPRLCERFLRSRLVSDMAERSHSLYLLRYLPDEAGQLVRSICELIFTTAAIIWLKSDAAPIAVSVALAAVATPFLAQRFLIERDLRVRNHAAALGRFYLDSLRGVIPIRTHAAESAIRYAHERMAVEWARAGLGLVRVAVAVDAFEYSASVAFALWLVVHSVNWTNQGDNASLLLLVYWALNLSAAGQAIALHARQYPSYRNIAVRLLEPLNEPDAHSDVSADAAVRHENRNASTYPAGVTIAMQQVSLRLSGSKVLHAVNLTLPAGSHVAIVGSSGAGKSSLVRMLLGFGEPSEGVIVVDGARLDAAEIGRIREQTAWVDPNVQLWNRSLIENLLYGSFPEHRQPVGQVLDGADLRQVLESLNDGLQTRLGESGAFVSGGEGQRVRFGRAMMRPQARLVILDEPFSGLDRSRRSALLLKAREIWKHATFLYITHQVSEAASFDRVVVLSEGTIVEDDAPDVLANHHNSRYRALLDSETTVRQLLASREMWRRLRIEGGQLIEDHCRSNSEPKLPIADAEQQALAERSEAELDTWLRSRR